MMKWCKVRKERNKQIIYLKCEKERKQTFIYLFISQLIKHQTRSGRAVQLPHVLVASGGGGSFKVLYTTIAR